MHAGGVSVLEPIGSHFHLLGSSVAAYVGIQGLTAYTAEESSRLNQHHQHHHQLHPPTGGNTPQSPGGRTELHKRSVA